MGITSNFVDTIVTKNDRQELGVQRVTIAVTAAAASGSYNTETAVAGTVTRAELVSANLANNANIKVSEADAILTTPQYPVNYTATGGAVNIANALAVRARVFGQLTVAFTGMTVGHSFILVLYIDPYADSEYEVHADLNVPIAISQSVPGTTNAVFAAGGTPFKNIDVDESEDAVCATACVLMGFFAYNNAAAGTKRFLKFYNATVGDTVVGTTVPVFVVELDGNQGLTFSTPIAFSTALTVAATTAVADADTGAPSANDVVLSGVYLDV